MPSSTTPDLKPSATGDHEPDLEGRFRELFGGTYGHLVAYARRRTTDWSEADDIVGEVYAIAWRRHGDLAVDAPPLPWLYGIAGNVVRNHRRAGSRRSSLVERLGSEPPRAVADPADRSGEGIRAALAQLSDDDQEVLRLVCWEGLSHAEVGQALGCSTNAVGIRIHRARQRLHAHLDDLDSSPDDWTTT